MLEKAQTEITHDPVWAFFVTFIQRINQYHITPLSNKVFCFITQIQTSKYKFETSALAIASL